MKKRYKTRLVDPEKLDYGAMHRAVTRAVVWAVTWQPGSKQHAALPGTAAAAASTRAVDEAAYGVVSVK